ncbi:unnamed protein product [Parascedosporium putredinis]|uniref:Nephrocystin 3-like N-terminal domain-containing protein n=1 Tax=Parascedosporium putredinis TaxID=1442378 RepID=A0A9P1HBV6_9PEZI|nr:unnamed protein product [Parascedosporium putredinis]CAI8004244.1 unnamed protein product [Parascedosporium putredinis]
MNPPTNQARSEIETAIREFKAALSNNELYNKILETKTVDQVYDALEDLQEKQAANNALGHLAKVSPYLDRLREYSGVLDTFAQVEPDILCLLWGPIKLLLQFASVLKQVHPRILALIFQDLLDFYSIALEFFKGSHWKLMYEALWPKKRAKIRVAVSNLERHCSQLRNRVQLEHLHDEANARTRAFEHFEKSEKANQRAEYRRIRESFSPKEYYADLERLGSLVCKGTDHWLEKDEDFLGWLQPSQTTGQIIWLQGIPGAGKTFLSSMVVRRALSVAPTLFAFLSHKLSTSTTARSITHSLLFQLCDNIEDLQEILCEEETQKLKLDLTAIVSVFGKLLRISGPSSL